jgi:hypothetical protein
MRDELLGYVLRALDRDEHQRVEEYLREQPAAQRALEALRSGLAPLAADNDPLSPPSGLAQRTCRLVAARRGMSECTEIGSSFGGGLTLRDYLIAASIILLTSTLLLPAIAQSRWQSQVLACQHRLDKLSTAMSIYSDHDGDGMLPYVPNRGPMAYAGVCASILSDCGYVDDPSVFYCPAANHPRGSLRIPTLDELRRASANQRKFNRLLSMLGDYAYVWGYEDNEGRYHGAQNRSRPYFPLLADCPPAGIHFASDLSSPNHGQSGLNLLFEDGHVRWYAGSADSFADHPFLNNEHHIAPGIGREDAVLAAGDQAPEF